MEGVTPFIFLACGFALAVAGGAWLIAPADQRGDLRLRLRWRLGCCGSTLSSIGALRTILAYPVHLARELASQTLAHKALSADPFRYCGYAAYGRILVA